MSDGGDGCIACPVGYSTTGFKTTGTEATALAVCDICDAGYRLWFGGCSKCPPESPYSEPGNGAHCAQFVCEAVAVASDSCIRAAGAGTAAGAGLNDSFAIRMVPSLITNISVCAFDGCKSIVGMVFRESSELVDISPFAFRNSSLSGINVPAKVRSVGASSFEAALELKVASFQKKSDVVNLGSSAFNSSGIVSILIPAGIDTIPDSVFLYCSSLLHIEFEERQCDDTNSVSVFH